MHTHVHILGVVCSTRLPDDEWMFRDLLTLKYLLASSSTRSEWLLTADQAGALPFESLNPHHDSQLEGLTIVPPDHLYSDFSYTLCTALENTPSDGRVILVLCGQCEGTAGGHVLFGPDSDGQLFYFKRSHLEHRVKEASLRPDQVVVVSTGCLSGWWQSDRWTLICAAEPDSSLHSRPLLRDIVDWLKQCLDCHDVPTSTEACEPSQRISIFPPSTIVPANLSSQLPLPAPASLDDETIGELEQLSHRVTAFHFPNSGNVVATMRLASIVVKHGAAAIKPQDQHKLLASLRGWSHDCSRAQKIAGQLGWTMTNPVHAEEWSLPNGCTEMAEAQSAGARILDAFEPDLFRGRWSSAPGSWLAAAWREAGRPLVGEEDWARVVAASG